VDNNTSILPANITKMAQGKGPIDARMAGKRKISDFFVRAPDPTSANQPPAEEPPAKRRTVPQNVSRYQLRYLFTIELSDGRQMPSINSGTVAGLVAAIFC
jgi:hypothetical protein